MTVNEDHTPAPSEDDVLDIFKAEIGEYGESRMTQQLIANRVDEREGYEMTRQNVNYALGQLTAAGWVEKIADGLYEFVEDPRERDA